MCNTYHLLKVCVIGNIKLKICVKLYSKNIRFFYIFFLYILEKNKTKKRSFENEFPEKTETFINLGFIYLINVV